MGNTDANRYTNNAFNGLLINDVLEQGNLFEIGLLAGACNLVGINTLSYTKCSDRSWSDLATDQSVLTFLNEIYTWTKILNSQLSIGCYYY